MNLEEALDRYSVRVSTDDGFQRRARLLQALWREDRGLPIGIRGSGMPLGSRLPLPFAKDTLSNFLTDNIKRAVRSETASVRQGSGQLVEEERLYANLLSSQPLCFNLFGELQADLSLATSVFRELWPERIVAVTAIRFEHSPGRGDLTYTGDHSAFDVFVEHTVPSGGVGFLGFEVKYHESLKVKAASFKPRYAEVATTMGCFKSEALSSLRAAPLEQIWRDHLLTGAMLAANAWKSGLYIFMYPAANPRCVQAVSAYRQCLSETSTFDDLTLERFVDILKRHTSDRWVSELHGRYLAWDKVDALSSDP